MTEIKDPKLMNSKNDLFLKWIKPHCRKHSKILVLGFYDEDFLKKLRNLNVYITIVDQETYLKQESVTIGNYDIIISRELIEHVHDQNKLVMLFHRMLNKNGIVLIETPNVHTWYSKLLFLFSDYMSFFFGKYIENYEHKHPLFTWSLHQLVKGKFKVQQLEFNFGVIPVIRLRFSTRHKLLGDSMNILLRKL